MGRTREETAPAAGRSIYFAAGQEFGRFKDGVAEILLGPPAGAGYAETRIVVTDVWGLSENEVFVAVTDADYYPYECSHYFVLWFDGNEFHSF